MKNCHQCAFGKVQLGACAACWEATGALLPAGVPQDFTHRLPSESLQLLESGEGSGLLCVRHAQSKDTVVARKRSTPESGSARSFIQDPFRRTKSKAMSDARACAGVTTRTMLSRPFTCFPFLLEVLPTTGPQPNIWGVVPIWRAETAAAD